MAQRKIDVPGIGEITLAKRRGTSHLRLSISGDGRVRVGMPYWAPYQSAIPFINSRRQWIQQHLATQSQSEFRNGQQIGKSHRLHLYLGGYERRSRITHTSIEIWSRLPIGHPQLQAQIKKASEKALKMQAEKLLPIRLREISAKNHLPYNSLKIRKLTSRWGSCSSQNDITLSYFLMQLPWPLIDYVLLHELVHTAHPYHGRPFWSAMENLMPDVKNRRKDLKAFRPAIQPS